ncbi:MAG: hypothetical protein AVDCRST_MAG93-9515, partial [uncultured Chloroflexia bacterium]
VLYSFFISRLRHARRVPDNGNTWTNKPVRGRDSGFALRWHRFAHNLPAMSNKDQCSGSRL